MKIEVEVSDRRILDLIVGLYENGISPWLRRIRPILADGVTSEEILGKAWLTGDSYELNQVVPLVEGCSAEWKVENPYGDDSLFIIVDKNTIAKGLGIMADKFPHHFADILNENDDATTSDIFGQCVVYGEEVFC